MLLRKDNVHLFIVQESMIRQLDKQIDKLEAQLKFIIAEDEQIHRLFKLVTSVKGVGLILGAHFLVSTKCFTCFDTSRQFACYSGVAPFKQQSGSSLNKRSRVSHYANKTIKTLLDRAASTAIQYDPELRAYYQSRVAQGKSKMSTLNIVRNKIIGRVFAVVKRGTPFVPLCKHAA